MPSTTRQGADTLSDVLTDESETAVTVNWEASSRKPGDGVWRASWTDGPTVAQLRDRTAQLARWIHPLKADTLVWSRDHSARAWALALLAYAHGRESIRAADAVGVVEHVLYADPYPERAWSHDAGVRALADLLAAFGHHEPMQIAHCLEEITGRLPDMPPRPAAASGLPGRQHRTILIDAPPPRDETSGRDETDGPAACVVCDGPIVQPRTGRTRATCSPACRQKAYRARHSVTKPQHVTKRETARVAAAGVQAVVGQPPH